MPVQYIYVITNPRMPGLVKIGRTARDDVETRMAELYSTGVPAPFRLEFACKVENGEEVESALHRAFQPYRPNGRREFFEIEADQAIAILELLHVEDATAEVENLARELLVRRPTMNYQQMGIPVGATLQFTQGSADAVVSGPRLVHHEGREQSLTALTQNLLGCSYSQNPVRFWTYNGRSLRDIYEQTYPPTPPANPSLEEN